MNPATTVSVIIPTRNRSSQLANCLAGLAHQTVDQGRFEVLIALDGPDSASASLAQGPNTPTYTRVVEAPRHGIAEAKNVAIAAAEGDLLLLLNDDILPEPDFIERHIDAQTRWSTPDRPVMVVGHSPWVAPPAQNDTLFDLMLRTTSMVFFYDQMIDDQGVVLRPPDHDWGYRHAWNLNLSASRAAVLDVGGFVPAIANCCYEDVELAYRFTRQLDAPVLFEPRARAPHDHAYSPEAFLSREWRLGYSAVGFADAAPDCALDVFGRDLLCEAELAYARAFVEREARAEPELLRRFQDLAATPASAVQAGCRTAVIGALHGQHLLLKRLEFRRGLLAAKAGEAVEGLFLPSDRLAREPGLSRAPAPS